MKKFRIDYILDGLAITLGAVQLNQIMQIVQLVLGIIATIISIMFSIWLWWKRASKDGKITEEEIKDGMEILNNGTKEIKDHLDNKLKK